MSLNTDVYVYLSRHIMYPVHEDVCGFSIMNSSFMAVEIQTHPHFTATWTCVIHFEYMIPGRISVTKFKYFSIFVLDICISLYIYLLFVC